MKKVTSLLGATVFRMIDITVSVGNWCPVSPELQFWNIERHNEERRSHKEFKRIFP